MRTFFKISLVFALSCFTVVLGQDVPQLNGKTPAEWRQKFIESGYLVGLNSVDSVSDQSLQVIADLLQDDSHISTQILNIIYRKNINPKVSSTNDLLRMAILLPSIQRHLISTNFCRRVEAIATIGSFGVYGKEYIGEVARLLDDENSSIRTKAAETLVRFEDSAIPFLDKMRDAYFREETNMDLKDRIKKAISKIEDLKNHMGRSSKE